jgi:hypothetical protein
VEAAQQCVGTGAAVHRRSCTAQLGGIGEAAQPPQQQDGSTAGQRSSRAAQQQGSTAAGQHSSRAAQQQGANPAVGAQQQGEGAPGGRQQGQNPAVPE